MDKQEYRVILEEISKAYLEENYDRVLMIAQELDVNKVSDNHILEIIADSYEKMGRPDIAREVLLIAYERTPMGRQMAFKLCDISIKMNDLDNAAEFYHDFCRMAPNDSKKYILKYEIGKKGGISRKNLVEVLEAYCEKEMDEKYKYELANLYRATGRKEECIELCDDIMLWFADGAYAKKAEKLKNACLGIMQQNKGRKKGTLSLYDDDNIEDIPDEQAKQYTQPKSEEIFDDAPAVEIQRMEDRPLMNENVSWRMPNKEFEPVITEPEPRPAQRFSHNDFDDNYDYPDDYANYYNNGNSNQGWDANQSYNDWNNSQSSGWTMIDESIQRGWSDPDTTYDEMWELPDDIFEQPVQEEFVEPVFGAHRPAHLRDDYVAPETVQDNTQNSPFAMPNRQSVNNYSFDANLQPQATPELPQANAYQAPQLMPTGMPPAPQLFPQAKAAPQLMPQANAYQAPTYPEQPMQSSGYPMQDYEMQQQEMLSLDEPSSLGAKPFAFSIAPAAAVQNEITPTPPTVGIVPNMSEKASLVKKPVLKVGPVDEIKYRIPGGEYQTPADVQVVQFEEQLIPEQQIQTKTFTSSTVRQTSIPAPKVLNPEPVKVVMTPDGTQSNLMNKSEKVSLGWDDNWGGDFRTWGALNMNDDIQTKAPEIDDEPDYFSTILEIPKDRPTFARNEVPFVQQVPQTKFVELKSGTPFADPRGIDEGLQEPVEYVPKRAGVISAALGASTVAAIASEPEENLTETQKAIRAFGAGELTTDDLLERDDLDLGDDDLNEEDTTPSDYRYNDEWQDSERESNIDEPSELRRFRNSGERFDFEPEMGDEFGDKEFDEEFPDEFDDQDDFFQDDKFTEAEKAIMAFDAMNQSQNELDFFEEEEELEEENDSQEDDFVDYESEFDEFDDQFEDIKQPKVIEQEWTEADMPEEEPILEDSEPEEFEELEEVEETQQEEEPELSDAEKAILAFESANIIDDEEDFDFDEDFDDVFNGEFTGEYTKKQSSEIEEEFEDIEDFENENVESEPEEVEEFTEEYDETEEFVDAEEYEEEFDETDEYEEAEEYAEEFDETDEYEEVEEYVEEFDEAGEYEEVEEYAEELGEAGEYEEVEEYAEEFDEAGEYEEAEEYVEEFDEAGEYEEVEEYAEELDETNKYEEENEEEDYNNFDEYEELVEKEEPETKEEIEESDAMEEADAIEEPETEAQVEEPETEEVEIPDIDVPMPNELREELSEFFLVEGMEGKIEKTFSDIVNAKNKGHILDANLIVAGDPKSGKTYLTIALIKAIGKTLGNGSGKVAKVAAASLRGKKMEKVFEKVVGSDLIIENIGYLDDNTTKDLLETLKSKKFSSMVVLEGNNLAIENLTSKFPEVKDLFKNHLEIDELSLPQWAEIASDYAKEQGYSIGDMASLALHAKIDELNVPTRRLSTADIIEIVEEAIENANSRLSPKVIKKKIKKHEDIELVEDDFS